MEFHAIIFILGCVHTRFFWCPILLEQNLTMASNMITSLLIVCIVTGSLLRFGDARNTYVCKPCKSLTDCEQEPNDFCLWDEVRDNCGRRTCARGPGERCGGPLDIYGKCGEGLMCKQDEKCHGCMLSPTDYNCFP
ncbi:neuroparsin-A-like [Onthophagus taurus]|uniref:neuroparsin-A-like n=1 Tax=Onthophagus taurus TaxID=166361 RepID=UPI000C200BA9|nr:neuroparsin-A-like [Onthophagus taurus]